jgi:ABC-type lipoprotein export system ATPase subunit
LRSCLDPAAPIHTAQFIEDPPMNDPRGSLWRKWDLHVHTPASLVHEYEGADPWPQFLDDLEKLPPEFRVIGINDYLFLDGYRRILEERKKGRLTNIDLILPVIELRLDKFGGSQGHMSRVNYHIIFSDELGPDLIEQQFLNALPAKYTLTPQYDHFRTSGQWKALPTQASLEDLGRRIIDSVPDTERPKFETPLKEGFNNLCLSHSAVTEALNSPYFKGKYVTAVGKTEWADIKWNDNTIADKKNIINAATFVFTASASPEQWSKARAALADGGVNARLLDCSDAHRLSTSEDKDRIGNSLTWVKADPTFQGLLQLAIEFEERHYVGDIPPQMARVYAHPTKYIKEIEIRRKPGDRFDEVWFDNKIPVNDGLVAIIGNKGKGKSALTDIIGLLANTKQNANFTFLSPQNFRQPRDNKAKHFAATLRFEAGTPVSKGLEELVDEQQPELVKYIPQNFLERICTQLGNIEESEFDREIKKVIFSHVDQAYRLGQSTLDNLIAYKTSEASQKIDLLKGELHRINEQIVALEDKAVPGYRVELQNRLDKKNEELAAHDANKPVEVSKPENDPARNQKIAEASEQIEAKKKLLAELDANIQQAVQRRATLAQLIATIDRVSGRVDNLDRQIQAFFTESTDDFARLGIAKENVVRVTIDKNPLTTARKAYVAEQGDIAQSLDPGHKGSFAEKKASIALEIKDLEDALDEPNRRFRAYETSLAAWEQQRKGIIGAADVADTVAYFEAQIADLANIPDRLKVARASRLAKSKEIHSVIRELADAYRELYAPVNTFIESRAIAKEKFHLNFEVGIVDSGFHDGFFDYVNQRVSGTFTGVEPGSKALNAMLALQDFNSEAGIEKFLTEIDDALHTDRRPGGKQIRVADQLKKLKTPLDLYDFVFSLGYLRPRYALRMGTKELSELSPGERGTLLLVFYLLVDKDDIPLMIDQPEENLDNQTVFDLLVPCIKDARQRRQIIIVTHNPNLAVVCDADQAIHADLDKAGNYRMSYDSGAIESPTINKAIVDILEGTMPAFKNRDSKYLIQNIQ